MAASGLDVRGAGRFAAPRPPQVELRELSAQTSIVALVGEHDLSTRLRLLEQLERVRMSPVVIVDLTRCTFIDSSIIEVLIVACQRSLSQRVEVVMPASGSLAERALELLGASQFLTTHASLERALASTQPRLANL